jgi:hypothetical protein
MFSNNEHWNINVGVSFHFDLTLQTVANVLENTPFVTVTLYWIISESENVAVNEKTQSKNLFKSDKNWNQSNFGFCSLVTMDF